MPSLVLGAPLLHLASLLLHLRRRRRVALGFPLHRLLALRRRLRTPALGGRLLPRLLLLLELSSLVPSRAFRLRRLHLLLELDGFSLAPFALLLEGRGFLLDSLPGGFQRRRGSLRGVELRVELLLVPLAPATLGLDPSLERLDLFLFGVESLLLLFERPASLRQRVLLLAQLLHERRRVPLLLLDLQSLRLHDALHLLLLRLHSLHAFELRRELGGFSSFSLLLRLLALSLLGELVLRLLQLRGDELALLLLVLGFLFRNLGLALDAAPERREEHLLLRRGLALEGGEGLHESRALGGQGLDENLDVGLVLDGELTLLDLLAVDGLDVPDGHVVRRLVAAEAEHPLSLGGCVEVVHLVVHPRARVLLVARGVDELDVPAADG